ncbi:hypothetical protein OF122_13210 [Pelagibacterium flavum]|uniref:Uncharacterized protein n=1 Tax=Pelagibacterium flavum TaxID=2984530 RepID=A0ABY6IKC5_9HYPH|nr:hypothetical protein [Pelagibacterium sp. YIM 151497]UYQ71018.1 hypothetical protein OF122_13210 [Pelagibacterium sp. YIM 151497]
MTDWRNPATNEAFLEWRNTFPEQHWSKNDLSACRLGFDAGYAAGDNQGSAWPAEAEYSYGQPVEKFTGEAQWDGVIVSAYHTTAGKLRYVVEVKPQGFQMIAVPSQLRTALRKSQGER